MKEFKIVFYENEYGKCHVEDFLLKKVEKLLVEK